MTENIRPDPTEVALRAAVRANLADSLPRLVFADWLDEQSDSHRRLLAEYIRLETELAGVPQDDPRGSQLIRRLIDVCEQSDQPLGGWEYEADLEQIRWEMDSLRASDPLRQARFGAARTGNFGHDYQVNPPIPETDLLTFEAKLGFLLPADYRAFLLHVGNGPMGPFYGLTPLDLNQNPEPLRRPFPFTREQADLAEEALKAGRTEEFLLFADEQYEDGHLHLCEIGCGSYQLLAVIGDTRGYVWGSGGMCELFLDRRRDGKPTSFLTWYETWLNGGLEL